MQSTVAKWYWDERTRAIEKHGVNNTPLNKDMSHADKLVIIAEEFGEVARAMTYDEGDPENLQKELIQLGTMAFMFALSLEEQ